MNGRSKTIREFLSAIGLSQYAELFESQGISIDVLSALDTSDLEKMGITLIGHQKAILMHASQLKTESTTGKIVEQESSSLLVGIRAYYQDSSLGPRGPQILSFAKLTASQRTLVNKRFLIPPDQQPLLLLNETFKKGKSGIILTNDSLVIKKNSWKRTDVTSMRVSTGMFAIKVNLNGKEVFQFSSIAKKFAPLIQEIFDSWLRGTLAVDCSALASEAILEDGESIEAGSCPKCGNGPVKKSPGGYRPGCLSVIIHLILCFITVGGWIPFWIGWAIGSMFVFKGKIECARCGMKLR